MPKKEIIQDQKIKSSTFEVDRYDGLKQKEHVYKNKICCQLAEKINEGFEVLSEAIKKIAGKNVDIRKTFKSYLININSELGVRLGSGQGRVRLGLGKGRVRLG